MLKEEAHPGGLATDIRVAVLDSAEQLAWLISLGSEGCLVGCLGRRLAVLVARSAIDLDNE